jgi:hypothetical protein
VRLPYFVFSSHDKPAGFLLLNACPTRSRRRRRRRRRPGNVRVPALAFLTTLFSNDNLFLLWKHHLSLHL